MRSVNCKTLTKQTIRLKLMQMSSELLGELTRSTSKDSISMEAVIVNTKLDEVLKNARVIFDLNFKGLEPILSLNEGESEVPMLNKGGISTVLAHVKSGKTFLVWLLASFATRVNEYKKIVSHLSVEDRVAIVDTEQGF